MGSRLCLYCPKLKGCTYDREDQRRLGVIADEVEEAIEQLAIDNVIGSKWHQGEQYKTLDYSRLTSLLIPALTSLANRADYLGCIVNGTNS